MHIFSNTKFRPATVSISFFCLALLFSGGCGNNKGKLYLTPVEQAAAETSGGRQVSQKIWQGRRNQILSYGGVGENGNENERGVKQ